MTAKQHIEAAMEMMDDSSVSRSLKKRLEEVAWYLGKREEPAKLFAVVTHDVDRGLRLVKSGEGPEAA